MRDSVLKECPFCGVLPEEMGRDYIFNHEITCIFTRGHLITSAEFTTWNTREKSPAQGKDVKGGEMLEQGSQASHEEICNQALAHYEEISDKAKHWSSTVPMAIKFYRDNYTKSPQGLRNDVTTPQPSYVEVSVEEIAQIIHNLITTRKEA